MHGTRTVVRRQWGFTLIEAMVVITILAILATIAVPSFVAMIRSNQANSVASDLVGALQFARSEAIQRGANVMVCPSTDSATCSGSTSWASGLIVRFPDTGSTFQVLQVRTFSGGSLTVTGPTSVTFKGAGTATSANFSVSVSSTANRVVCLMVGGRSVTKTGTTC